MLQDLRDRLHELIDERGTGTDGQLVAGTRFGRWLVLGRQGLTWPSGLQHVLQQLRAGCQVILETAKFRQGDKNRRQGVQRFVCAFLDHQPVGFKPNRNLFSRTLQGAANLVLGQPTLRLSRDDRPWLGWGRVNSGGLSGGTSRPPGLGDRDGAGVGCLVGREGLPWPDGTWFTNICILTNLLFRFARRLLPAMTTGAGIAA